MDMWNAPVVQLRQPLTYRLMKVWAWEAQDDLEAADREGLQRVQALMIGIPRELILDLPFTQLPASWKGMWMLPLNPMTR